MQVARVPGNAKINRSTAPVESRTNKFWSALPKEMKKEEEEEENGVA